MDLNRLLELFDKELRNEIEIPGVTKEVFPGLVRMTRPAPGMNYILYSRLDPADLDGVIEAQVDHFSRMDQPFSWHVYRHDLPESLGQSLEAHGFEKDDDPDFVLVFDLADGHPKSQVPEGVEVKQIIDPDQLEDVRRVEQQVLGGDFAWLVKRLKSHLAVPNYLSVYVAYQDRNPVCSGWIYYPAESQFASLYGGATIKDYRGRGIYHAVVEKRLSDAEQRGRRFVTAGAGPLSRPILEKVGFIQLTVETDYVWKSRI